MKKLPTATTPTSANAAAGMTGGTHQGLHRPGHSRRVAHVLEQVGLEDRGESIDDHLRDRHSKGVRDAYDDSIDHAATTAAARSQPG